jgi:hypothetical protein
VRDRTLPPSAAVPQRALSDTFRAAGEDVMLTMVAVSEPDLRDSDDAKGLSLKIAHDERWRPRPQASGPGSEPSRDKRLADSMPRRCRAQGQEGGRTA